MPSGTSALVLRTTVVVAVLAVLVLPSLGRCPSLGPAPAPPPPPTPVPPPPPTLAPPPLPTPAPLPPPSMAASSASAPGPAQPISCNRCISDIMTTCTATILPKCSQQCDGVPAGSTSASCSLCKDGLLQQCSDTSYRDCPNCLPAPPPPALPSPPLAPGQAPPISCDDCWSNCTKTCSASIPEKCSQYCDNVDGSCNACRDTIIEQCTAGCSNCDEKCKTAADNGCSKPCSTIPCWSCESAYEQSCRESCDKNHDCAGCVE